MTGCADFHCRHNGGEYPHDPYDAGMLTLAVNDPDHYDRQDSADAEALAQARALMDSQ